MLENMYKHLLRQALAPTLPHRRAGRPAGRARTLACLAGLALLTACGTRPANIGEPGLYAVAAYTGTEDFIWCVPYARQISGVRIRGDADTWWSQAAGRYERGQTPAPYSVLTLEPDSRLRDGHVAVVTGIVGPREIRVSHANWGWTAGTRGRVYEHMPVIDVSPANDWSQVRFKHPAVGGFGRAYPALGFIHSGRVGPETRVARAETAPLAPRARPAPPPSSQTRTPAETVSARAAMNRLF